MNKQKVMERLQTLMDVVDERYENISVHSARELEGLIEAMFEAVCRRGKK